MTDIEAYNALLKGAKEHGDAEGSDAEAGDLQEFFAAAFFLLTEDQKKAFWVSVGDTLDLPEYEGIRKSDFSRSTRTGGGADMSDFGQRVAAMDRRQLETILILLAEAWDRNDTEEIGIILMSNDLTQTEEDEDDLE